MGQIQDVVLRSRNQSSRTYDDIHPGNPLPVSVNGFGPGGSSASADAFGRLRVSDPFTQFDWKNVYAPATFSNQLFWDTAVNGGSISVVTNGAAIRLSTGGTSNGTHATVQTKEVFIYQPGKSRFVLQTFVMGAAVSNGVAEIGYGDANDGVFLRRSGSDVNLTIRSAVSGAVTNGSVAQRNWIDPMDGTGASGITLDFTKSQIMAIDMEWLGVGRVRIYFVVDGAFYLAHEFKHANNIAGVYMRNGSLPIRARVENSGTAGGTLTMDVICTSVMSEGGYDSGSYPQFSASNAITSRNTSTSFLPLISIRPKASFNGFEFFGQIVPQTISLLVASQIHEYRIIKNGTLTGASWADVNSTYSAAQVDVSATTISDGVVLDAGYIPAAGATRNTDITNLFSKSPLVQTSLNKSLETITIAVRTVTSTGSAYGTIMWQERY